MSSRALRLLIANVLASSAALMPIAVSAQNAGSPPGTAPTTLNTVYAIYIPYPYRGLGGSGGGSGWGGGDPTDPANQEPPPNPVCINLQLEQNEKGCHNRPDGQTWQILAQMPPNSGLGKLLEYQRALLHGSNNVFNPRGLSMGLAVQRYMQSSFSSPSQLRNHHLTLTEEIQQVCRDQINDTPPYRDPADPTGVRYIHHPFSMMCLEAAARLVAESGGPLDTELAVRNWMEAYVGPMTGGTRAAPWAALADWASNMLFALINGTLQSPQNSLDFMQSSLSKMRSCKLVYDLSDLHGCSLQE